ncbi:uncharacterized protein LOC122062380 isoform X2 [Macadamia integrifolia]|uniref:uncharacterized protein LOC122062380 isoform X2 n=1 Tax=Macadamia integrifolia TaxID=60698 RepID=UPI001C4F07C0|nr:uncharacterized protein LOC122062380 isoform X2 [Macadamia integrifolia]
MQNRGRQLCHGWQLWNVRKAGMTPPVNAQLVSIIGKFTRKDGPKEKEGREEKKKEGEGKEGRRKGREGASPKVVVVPPLSTGNIISGEDVTEIGNPEYGKLKTKVARTWGVYVWIVTKKCKRTCSSQRL